MTENKIPDSGALNPQILSFDTSQRQARTPTGYTQKTFVVAPDILLDYPGVIPGSTDSGVPTPDPSNVLYDAKLIIPEIALTILDEASHETGPIARQASTTLRLLMRFCNNGNTSLQRSFNLNAFMPTSRGGCEIAILPLSRDFIEEIPWVPLFASEADSATVLTALAAILTSKNKLVQGQLNSGSKSAPNDFWNITATYSATYDDYTLVTNSPTVTITANLFGIPTMRYRLPAPPTHTGIRYYVIPDDLYDQFTKDLNSQLPIINLAAVFPREPSFKINEYVIFYRASHVAKCGQSPVPGRIFPDSEIVEKNLTNERDYRYVGIAKPDIGAIIHLRYIQDHLDLIPFNNPEYAAYVDALHDPSIDTVIVTGAAGTGKTYGAFNTALEECMAGTYMRAFVVKDGDHEIGAVPGGTEQKMAPLVEFGRDAIGSRLAESDEIQKKRNDERRRSNNSNGNGNGNNYNGSSSYERIQTMLNSKWSHNFTSIPYQDAESRTFVQGFVILDEFQRTTVDKADTLLTRQGRNSKMVVLGDVAQIDSSTKVRRDCNGLVYAHELFQDISYAAIVHLIRGQRCDSTSTIVERRSEVRAKFGLPD